MTVDPLALADAHAARAVRARSSSRSHTLSVLREVQDRILRDGSDSRSSASKSPHPRP